MTKLGILFLLTLLSGCTNHQAVKPFPTTLPKAVSNNAVAYLSINGQDQFYSFNGLTAGKTYQDITNEAYVWQSGDWQQLNVPVEQLPVLASTAVSVKDSVYLFGGYTVEADHSEKSVHNVWKISGLDHQFKAMPAMPTPVDDAVALVYQDRYIYLISGWHDVDNVDLVQVFDTVNQTWQFATPFPLPPVFGHAGGIIDNQMLVCDGVKVIKTTEKKQFVPSAECAIGTINRNDPLLITWQVIPHHSGTAYYRMAAASDDATKVYFAGGSVNPYNYDGIGYDQQPSEPSDGVRVFDLITRNWQTITNKIPRTMDHRALLKTPHGFMILGGMREKQSISSNTILFN